MAQNFTFAQLSTAGEQVPSCNITTPFWRCYGFDFSSSKILFQKGAGICAGMRRSHAAKNSLDNQVCLPTFSSHATHLRTLHVQINPNNSHSASALNCDSSKTPDAKLQFSTPLQAALVALTLSTKGKTKAKFSW